MLKSDVIVKMITSMLFGLILYIVILPRFCFLYVGTSFGIDIKLVIFLYKKSFMKKHPKWIHNFWDASLLMMNP